MSAKSANHDHMTFLSILWQGIHFKLWEAHTNITSTVTVARKQYTTSSKVQFSRYMRSGVCRDGALQRGVGSLGPLHCVCVYKHSAVAITKTVSCA